MVEPTEIDYLGSQAYRDKANESMYDFIREINEKPFISGYKFFDQTIGDGTMISPEVRVLYGDGGTMKTQFALSEIKRHLNSDNNNLVVLHSLEMPINQIQSLIMRMMFYDYHYKSEDSQRAYEDRFNELCDGRLIIVNDYRTMGQIEAFAYGVSEEFPKKRVHNYIDSLSLLDMDDEHYNDDNAMAKKAMARIQRMNTIHRSVTTLIHHNNKEGEYLGSVAIRNISRIMIEFTKQEPRKILLRFEKLTRQNIDSDYMEKVPYLLRSKETGEMLEGAAHEN